MYDYQPNIKYKKGKEIKRKINDSKKERDESCVSMREFYCFYLHRRNGLDPLLLNSKRLFHEYLVDIYCKYDSYKLKYLYHNQNTLRAEVYSGFKDSTILDANVLPSEIGKRIILPASYYGSARHMHQQLQDSMCYVRKFGKPDLFLTMTMNPSSSELLIELPTGVKPSDRPDYLARIFKQKLIFLLKLVTKDMVLGEVIAYQYVIEFQKRGLPHVHLLCFLKDSSKPRTSEQIDKIISAQLPNELTQFELYQTIKKCNIHGPCGIQNIDSPCMEKGNDGIKRCSKNFPKNLQDKTTNNKKGYPNYKRPDNGRKVFLNEKEIDNTWIVPYNPLLSQLLNCHVNVEICNSIVAVQYLFKYVWKGPDHAEINISYDEIKNYVDARWVGACEAVWRLFGFELHGRYPPIQRLHVHCKNDHYIVFDQNDTTENILKNKQSSKSTLEEFFKLCENDDLAKTLLYHEVPEYFVWTNEKKWKRRERGFSLARIASVNVSQGERYFLRLLLNNIRGPKSYEFLKKIKGVSYSTFKEAARAFGLLKDDLEYYSALSDSKLTNSAFQMRNLFVTILIFGEVSDPRALYDTFIDDMAQDKLFSVQKTLHEFNLTLTDHHRFLALKDIYFDLESRESRVDFNLPKLPNTFLFSKNRLIDEELLIKNDYLYLVEKLTLEQKNVFDKIIKNVNYKKSEKCSNVYFLNGKGGTGFFYNKREDFFISRNLIENKK